MSVYRGVHSQANDAYCICPPHFQQIYKFPSYFREIYTFPLFPQKLRFLA